MSLLKNKLLSTLVGNFEKNDFNERELFKECSVFYMDDTKQIFYVDVIENTKVTNNIVASCFTHKNRVILFSVRKSYQRQGLGQLLLEYVCSKLDNLELHVRESNIAAFTLYKKVGFIEKEVLENYYSYTSKNENGILMTRNKQIDIIQKEEIVESKTEEKTEII